MRISFIEECQEQFDLIALDIENGSKWLSHQENQRLYNQTNLRLLEKMLKDGGRAVFWSAESCEPFKLRLAEIFEEINLEVVYDHDGSNKPIAAYLYFVK